VAAGFPEPCNADPVAGDKSRHSGTNLIHMADDLVSRNAVGSMRLQVAFGEVQVSAADPAGCDGDPNLT
jgi:hypothetical protein